MSSKIIKPRNNSVNGWLVVDKPQGISSFKVVSIIKHLLKPTKVGHAGTLDPEATGLLAVALGEATKTITYQTDTEKKYTFFLKIKLNELVANCVKRLQM